MKIIKKRRKTLKPCTSHQVFPGAFFRKNTFLSGVFLWAVLILLFPGNTVLAAGTPSAPITALPQSIVSAPEEAEEPNSPQSPHSQEKESGISPAVIIAVLILPLLSIGLTIGTAVIIIQYKKSHPSLPPKDEKKPDSQKESSQNSKNPPM